MTHDPICRECNQKPCVCARGVPATDLEQAARAKIIADRLDELALAVANGDRSEFTMRVPAQPDRDADLVLSEAARLLRTALDAESGRAEAVLPCGHPASLLIKSVESDHQHCELCDAYERRNDAERRERELIAERDALKQRAERAEAALGQINDIRNSIIGTQTMNWSEHVYQLVKALDDAGITGMAFPSARKFYGTLCDRLEKAEAERDALTARLAAAEADARRYRSLRKRQEWPDVYVGVDSEKHPGTWALFEEEADAAIDAAIAQETKNADA